MHKTYVNRLLDTSRRARGAGRFGFVGGLAWLAALLVMAPVTLSIAAAPPEKSAAPPEGSAAPPEKSPPPPASAATPPPAPAAPPPPAAAPPEAAPQSGTFKRVDIYGTMVSAVSTTVTLPPEPGAKPGAKKVTEKRTTKATVLSLVVTSSDPLPVGKKGTLFRKVEKAGDLAATTWVKVAEMTLRNVDPTNKMLFDVDLEVKDVLINGKKEDHFKKGTKIKVQIDVRVDQ